MPGRTRSTAKARIEMSHMENRIAGDEAAPTIQEVAQKLREHVDAAVAALGKAAGEGDVQAAKAILDFVRAADQEESTTKGRDTLKLVADIRAGSRRKREEPNGPTAEWPAST